MLCDLNNINKVKDRIPADKLNDLSFDADSLSLSTPMGAVRLRIVDREVHQVRNRGEPAGIQLLDTDIASDRELQQDEANN